MGPCYFSQFRDSPSVQDLVSKKSLPLPDVQTDATTSTSNSTGSTSNGLTSSNAELQHALQESMASHSEHQNNLAASMDKFSRVVAEVGMKVRGHTPNDGNCLFWAASDQLDLVSAATFTNVQLRNNTVKYMQALPEDKKANFNNFLSDTDLDTYTRELSKDGTYADNISITALSETLSCKIKIISACRAINIIGDPSASTELTLGYMPEIKHYVSLEDIPRYIPNVDDFVAVRLTSRKRKRMYIGKILKVDKSGDTQVQVRYMVETSPGIFTWGNELPSWQTTGEIIGKLSMQPELLPGRGLRMKLDIEELAELRKKL